MSCRHASKDISRCPPIQQGSRSGTSGLILYALALITKLSVCSRQVCRLCQHPCRRTESFHLSPEGPRICVLGLRARLPITHLR